MLETTADVYYVVVVALGLLGLPALLRRRHPKRLFVAVVMAGMGALPFILFGDPRYHVPVLPFLVIAAAARWALGADRAAGRRHAQHRRPQRKRCPGDDGAFESGEEQGGGVDGG